MAIEAATRRKQFYNGTHGNLAAETFKVVLNAAPAGSEIEMGVIPAGVEVVKVDVIHDNLGAGTSVDIGYRYVDEEDGSEDLTYWGSVTTATAGDTGVVKKPKRFEKPVLMIVKLKGAEGTGEVYVIPTAISRGVK